MSWMVGGPGILRPASLFNLCRSLIGCTQDAKIGKHKTTARDD